MVNGMMLKIPLLIITKTKPQMYLLARFSLSKSAPFLSMSSFQALQPPLPLGLHNENPNKLLLWLFL